MCFMAWTAGVLVQIESVNSVQSMSSGVAAKELAAACDPTLSTVLYSNKFLTSCVLDPLS